VSIVLQTRNILIEVVAHHSQVVSVSILV
jgi:hypothetical protein